MQNELKKLVKEANGNKEELKKWLLEVFDNSKWTTDFYLLLSELGNGFEKTDLVMIWDLAQEIVREEYCFSWYEFIEYSPIGFEIYMKSHSDLQEIYEEMKDMCLGDCEILCEKGQKYFSENNDSSGLGEIEALKTILSIYKEEFPNEDSFFNPYDDIGYFLSEISIEEEIQKSILTIPRYFDYICENIEDYICFRYASVIFKYGKELLGEEKYQTAISEICKCDNYYAWADIISSRADAIEMYKEMYGEYPNGKIISTLYSDGYSLEEGTNSLLTNAVGFINETKNFDYAMHLISNEMIIYGDEDDILLGLWIFETNEWAYENFENLSFKHKRLFLRKFAMLSWESVKTMGEKDALFFLTSQILFKKYEFRNTLRYLVFSRKISFDRIEEAISLDFVPDNILNADDTLAFMYMEANSLFKEYKSELRVYE